MPTKKKPISKELKSDLSVAIEGVAEQLQPVYHLESVADNLGGIQSALDSLANATALRAIAEHGSPEDREVAIGILKKWFYEDFRDQR